MPIEQERKIVLNLSVIPELINFPPKQIKQGYLAINSDGCIRLRQEGVRRDDSDYLFCFKKQTEHGLIEIEKKISQKDFDRLWPLIIGETIIKNRYYLGGGFTVDIFMKDGSPYKAIAEIELPEGQIDYPEPPEIIKKHLNFVVPFEQNQLYSNAEMVRSSIL